MGKSKFYLGGIQNKIFLSLGLAWIALNIYFLPFFAWTTGIVRPWLMLHGYIPYRDFVWMRTPLDIFLLSGWFKILGVADTSYQHFIFLTTIAIALLVFLLSYRNLPNWKFSAFIFFIIFLFPLFQNIEIGELLVGLWSLLLFGFLFKYLSDRRLYLLVICGIISGISIITKQNSGAVSLAALGIIIFDSIMQKKHLIILAKRCLVFSIAAVLPLAGLIFFYAYNNGLLDLFYYSVELVLGKYNSQPLPPGFSRGDALWIEGAYFALLIPFLLYWKRTGLTIQKILLFPAFLIALYPSVLPSYLSYRTFTAFPIVSLLAGYNIIILLKNGGVKNYFKVKTLIIILSFASFIMLTLRFINPYIQSIKDEGFRQNNFIKDYGNSEYQVSSWIKNNTAKDEKIMSFTNSIVYLLSDRLPQNKYIDPFPYILYPYEKTSDVFAKQPPRIMIIDESLFQDFPDLANWPFYKKFMKENYIERKRFDNLIIYELVISSDIN